VVNASFKNVSEIKLVPTITKFIDKFLVLRCVI
jgi:hypothetical protein